MNNLFISTTFIDDGYPVKKAIDLCKNNGISSVELGSNHCYEKDYNYLLDYQFKFLIHNYFPIPKDSFVLNIASFQEEIRSRSIDHIIKAINFCHKINGLLYTFHPGFLTDPKGSNITNDNYDFQWDEKKLNSSNYSKAKELMYDSLDIIIDYAKQKKINIAIETEGSVSKKDHLLMQTPREFDEFISTYKPNEVGINLNIGHLNLASKAFNFDKREFVDLIQQHIVAMELSHNDGIEDDHLPLQEIGWYWEFINDNRFNHIIKILEFRNVSIKKIKDNIELIKKMKDEI